MPTELKTSKSDKKNAIAMQDDILANSQDINNVLSTSGKISPLLHTHYTNMQTGQSGIAALIAEILKEREAVYPAEIGNTEYRAIAIASSLYTWEIVNEVQARFAGGSIRYPKETIENYLSVFMFRNNVHTINHANGTTTSKFTPGLSSLKVGKIQLTNKEDKPRPCKKPRCKWFLLNSTKI